MPLFRIVQNFITAGFKIDYSQPRECQDICRLDLYQNSQFLIHILYPLVKWFVTYFELALRTIMHNFIVYVLTCDSKFCLGGLGSCAHTVSELVLKNTIVKNLE